MRICEVWGCGGGVGVAGGWAGLTLTSAGLIEKLGGGGRPGGGKDLSGGFALSSGFFFFFLEWDAVGDWDKVMVG